MKVVCRQQQAMRQRVGKGENPRERLLLWFLIALEFLILTLPKDAVRHICSVVNSPPLPKMV